jgi:hypothetical protein
MIQLKETNTHPLMRKNKSKTLRRSPLYDGWRWRGKKTLRVFASYRERLCNWRENQVYHRQTVLWSPQVRRQVNHKDPAEMIVFWSWATFPESYRVSIVLSHNTQCTATTSHLFHELSSPRDSHTVPLHKKSSIFHLWWELEDLM